MLNSKKNTGRNSSSCKKSFYFLLLCLLVDLSCVGIIVPLLPQIARKEIGVSPTLFGLIGTCYGLTQVVGDPVLGWLSDKKGRKVVLLLSLLGSIVGYSLVGFAASFASLLLSRLIVGLFKQTMTVSSAYIVDITHVSERASAIGLIRIMANLGFIIGPFIGGLLSTQYGLRFPVFLASSVFVVLALFVQFFLPESNKSCGSHSDEAVATPSSPPLSPESDVSPLVPTSPTQPRYRKPSSFSTRWGLVTGTVSGFILRKGVVYHLIIRLLSSLDVVLVYSVFPLILDARMHVTAAELGFISSLQSLLKVLVRAVGVPLATKYLSHFKIMVLSCVSLLVAYFLLIASASFAALFPALVLLAMGWDLLETCLTSSFTTLFPHQEIGSALGLYGWVESFCRLVAPVAGGLVMDRLSVSAPFYVALGLNVILLFFLAFAPCSSSPICESESKSMREKKEE